MMTLQILSDLTINGPFGFRVYGPGELLTLPARDALRIMILEPGHFRIVTPIPLIIGVAVRWLLQDDRLQGPGIVQLVDGEPHNRQVSVLMEGELRWIHERDLVEIDPWPAIDAKLGEAVDAARIDGEESPKIIEVRDWLWTYFDGDRYLWQR